jgi:rare lipoprotein A
LQGCSSRRKARDAGPGYHERGLASWYGPGFHGKRTANGEVYDMNAMTAAHKELPFESIVEVRNLDNGKKTQVRITDREQRGQESHSAGPKGAVSGAGRGF